MSWLTSPFLFYASLPISLAAPFLLLSSTARYRATGRTLNESFRDILRPDFSEIHDMLERLLKSGFDHSFLVVTFKKTKYFIQFRKYIHAKGDYGIELGFPLADWSKTLVPRLRHHCATNGIDFAEGTEVPGDALAFLHVDFGKDTAAAFGMAEAIVTEVFRIPIDSQYKWEFSGLHPHDELIDSPRRRPPSHSATWRRTREDTYARTGIHLSDTPWSMLAGLCGYSGAVGLLHGLIWRSFWAATDQAPDWGAASLPLLDMALNARNFDLVCIGLIAIAMAISRSPPGRRVRSAQRKGKQTQFELPQWLGLVGRIFPRRLRLPAILAATIAFWFV